MTVAETKALLERRRASITLDSPRSNVEALKQLAVRCHRYSPVVGIDNLPEPDSILIDLTGCEHLFDGEDALARRLVADLRRRDYTVQVSIADTIGAAWAAAHYSVRRNSWRIVSDSDFLNRLPVECLRLKPSTVETLRDFSLYYVGQLEQLPRQTLPSRFGRDVLHRLDQAFDRLPETFEPIVPEKPIAFGQDIEPPVSDRRVVELVTKQLLRRLLNAVGERGDGLLRIRVELFCVKSETAVIEIETVRPSRAESHWIELIELKFERIPLQGDVHRILITNAASAPTDARQTDFFDAEQNESGRRSLSQLLDRLSNRIGCNRVVRLGILPEAQPEFAAQRATLNAEVTVSNELHSPGIRPLHLECKPTPVKVLSIIPDGPPCKLTWQAKEYGLPRCWGPERIETGWWREAYVQRDYYRVETDDGRHLWLFRNSDGEWFLHGTFE